MSGRVELVVRALERGYLVVSVVDDAGHHFELRRGNNVVTSTRSMAQMIDVLALYDIRAA